jgi:hypothetical protein
MHITSILSTLCDFFRNTVQTYVLIHISIHSYEHMYVHPTPMSISERLSRFDLEIHEVGHQECFTVDRKVTSHLKNN